MYIAERHVLSGGRQSRCLGSNLLPLSAAGDSRGYDGFESQSRPLKDHGPGRSFLIPWFGAPTPGHP